MTINEDLIHLLKEKKCFKLICGAGNEDEKEVEKLVFLYAKAGCKFFDLSANLNIIKAAKRAIKKCNDKEKRFLCVSVGIKGDPHINKAKIIKNKCIKCKKCEKICPQNAIKKGTVIKEKCIGCSTCLNECKNNAIQIECNYKNLNEILPPIISEEIDCIEFHAISDNENDIYEKWKVINSLYKGILSICIDRQKLCNEKLSICLQEMIKSRNPYTTIVQADGTPMSGGKDDFKTTLQAIATAEIVQNQKLPIFTIISGGTNSKSTELAKLCNIEINGVAIGSFARKIVKEFISKDDFYNNKTNFNKALNIAKNLIDISLKFLR